MNDIDIINLKNSIESSTPEIMYKIYKLLVDNNIKITITDYYVLVNYRAISKKCLKEIEKLLC